jgi:hypothetical protein
MDKQNQVTDNRRETYAEFIEKQKLKKFKTFRMPTKESENTKISPKQRKSIKTLTYASTDFIPKLAMRKSTTLDSQAESGDKIFKEKINSLDKLNCFKTASSYFRIAYRNIRILHFAEDSVAYKNYFFTTNPLFRDIKMYL